jgi:hypothetical protein
MKYLLIKKLDFGVPGGCSALLKFSGDIQVDQRMLTLFKPACRKTSLTNRYYHFNYRFQHGVVDPPTGMADFR